MPTAGRRDSNEDPCETRPEAPEIPAVGGERRELSPLGRIGGVMVAVFMVAFWLNKAVPVSPQDALAARLGFPSPSVECLPISERLRPRGDDPVAVGLAGALLVLERYGLSLGARGGAHGAEGDGCRARAVVHPD